MGNLVQIKWINRLNQRLGQAISWLTLVMVVTTFLVVVLRYVFNMGWVWLQEIVSYSHAIVFLAGVGYTLARDEHVRVDIFYRKLDDRGKAWVNLLGFIFLLLPFCLVIFFQSFNYVLDSWSVLEGSKDGGGLEAVFFLKSFIWVYCFLLLLQGFALAAESFEKVR